jgi:hypothetical protein
MGNVVFFPYPFQIDNIKTRRLGGRGISLENCWYSEHQYQPRTYHDALDELIHLVTVSEKLQGGQRWKVVDQQTIVKGMRMFLE